MRTKAFGKEPAGSLLDSMAVARASLDALIEGGTGHVIDLRRADPFASHRDAVEAAEDLDNA